MECVRLTCPQCGFTIEQYKSEELENIRRKFKRYQYLLNKSNICPMCLASGRLKEIRTDETEVVWSEQALAELPQISSANDFKAKAEDFAKSEGYGEITVGTLGKVQERING